MSDKTHIPPAFNAGYSAYLADVDWYNNPFRHDCTETGMDNFCQWCDGWDQAQREHELDPEGVDEHD